MVDLYLSLHSNSASTTYISPSFIKDHQIPKVKLPHPIYAYNADDTLNSTAITHRVKLGCAFKGHISSEWFFVTNIGSKDMIIGMTWLCSHNPEINWHTGEILFSCCPPVCKGQGSIRSTFNTMVDDSSSTDTQYSASYAIQQLRQKIQAKEHAATTWAIEDFRNKKVLTIEDIKKGPFKEYADIFEERTYQELPPHVNGITRSTSSLTGNQRFGNHTLTLYPMENKRSWMHSSKKTLPMEEFVDQNPLSPLLSFSSKRKMESYRWSSIIENLMILPLRTSIPFPE